MHREGVDRGCPYPYFIQKNYHSIHAQPIVFDIHMGTTDMGITDMGSTRIDCYLWVSMSLYIFYPIFITISEE